MNKRLGIIDSGIGGLTFLKEIFNQNLNLDCFYCSDSQNVPYGNKSQEFMISQMSKMTQNLLSKKVHAILIACNTATAESINQLRTNFDIPFIGVEPFINHRNINQSPQSQYALILTQATFKSQKFKNLKKKLDPNNLIDIYPLSNLALIIERLKTQSFAELKKEIDSEIQILQNKNYTHLILGCTHYPIIQDYLKQKLNTEIINPDIHIIDHLIKKLELTAHKKLKTFLYSEDCGQSWHSKEMSDLKFLNLSIY